MVGGRVGHHIHLHLQGWHDHRVVVFVSVDIRATYKHIHFSQSEEIAVKNVCFKRRKHRYHCQLIKYNRITPVMLMRKSCTHLAHMEPARALVLASSQKDTVADLASRLKLADSLLRLLRLWEGTAVATSACTSSLNTNSQHSHTVIYIPLHTLWEYNKHKRRQGLVSAYISSQGLHSAGTGNEFSNNAAH